jgi:histidyl-tRNA synthetase
MLVGDRGEAALEVAVVAENVSREVEASALVAGYRRAGFTAEAFVSGSPRKRYDRAKKQAPALLVSLDVRDGLHTHGLNLLDAEYRRADEAQALFDQFRF